MPQSSLSLPLLITGITGVAGYNAFFYFRDQYPSQVIGIRPRQIAGHFSKSQVSIAAAVPGNPIKIEGVTWPVQSMFQHVNELDFATAELIIPFK